MDGSADKAHIVTHLAGAAERDSTDLKKTNDIPFKFSFGARPNQSQRSSSGCSLPTEPHGLFFPSSRSLPLTSLVFYLLTLPTHFGKLTLFTNKMKLRLRSKTLIYCCPPECVHNRPSVFVCKCWKQLVLAVKVSPDHCWVNLIGIL